MTTTTTLRDTITHVHRDPQTSTVTLVLECKMIATDGARWLEQYAARSETCKLTFDDYRSPS